MNRLILICIVLSSCGRQDRWDLLGDFGRQTIPVGDSTIDVYRFETQGNTPGKFYTYLNVHYNESTSVAAAKKLVKQVGGRIMVLQNPDGARNQTFSVGGETFEFDPNRIFTDDGIRETLVKHNGRSPAIARQALRNFRNSYLRESGILANSSILTVALHNNTDGGYSLASYLPGGAEDQSAARVHESGNSGTITRDRDDFFYTTNGGDYEYLANRNHNTILQDNVNVIDDGSLSVWSGRHNSRYINVEAEVHHEAVQFHMLEALQGFD